MKILLTILSFIESFIGLTASSSDITPAQINVAWTNGSKVAIITITFKSVSILTSTIVSAFNSLVKSP